MKKQRKGGRERVGTGVASEARTKALPLVKMALYLSDHHALNVRLLLRELIIAMPIKKMPYCPAMRPHIALPLTNQIAI